MSEVNFKIEKQGEIGMKDVQLREAFKTQIATRSPFVAAVLAPNKGKDGEMYFQLSIIQEQESEREVDPLDAELMAWGKKISLERTFRNVKVSALTDETYAKYCKVGNVIEGTNLQIHHVTEKPYEKANPINIADNDTGELVYLTAEAGQTLEDGTVTKGGELVYKVVKMVTGKPNHFKIKLVRTPESAFKGVAAVETVGELEIGTEM